LALIFSAISIAWRLGGEPERFGAAIIAAMTAASLVGHQLFPFRYVKLDFVSTVIDLLGFASFCAIALFARRVWPLWASSLQLTALMAHLVRGLNIHIHPVAYALMSWGPTDLIPAILIIGTVNHRLMKRKGVNVKPWRSWSEP